MAGKSKTIQEEGMRVDLNKKAAIPLQKMAILFLIMFFLSLILVHLASALDDDPYAYWKLANWTSSGDEQITPDEQSTYPGSMQAYEDTFFSDNLVSLWKLNGDATDSKGSNDGTPTELTYDDGVRLEHGEFNGINSSIEIIDTASLDIINEITISTWIYRNEGMYYRLISKRGATDGYDLNINNFNKLQFSFGNGSTAITHSTLENTIPINEWVFVSATKNSTHINFYINGKLNRSIEESELITSNAINVFIGRYSASAVHYFNGSIDSVYIWNRSLTTDEIAHVYNATKPPELIDTPEGKGMEFDGNDYIDLGTTGDICSQTQLTIETYVNLTSLGLNRRIISKDETNADYYLMYHNTNKIRFGANNLSDTAIDSTKVFNSSDMNKYYHIISTYNGTKTCLYIDGELDICEDATGNIDCSSAQTVIGVNPISFNEFFNGTIDYVRIWDQSLSEDEILGLYNEIGMDITYDSPVQEGNNSISLLIINKNITNSSGASVVYNNTDYPGVINYVNSSYVEFSANVTTPIVYLNNTAVSFYWNYSLAYSNGTNRSNRTGSRTQYVFWNLTRYPRVNITLLDVATSLNISNFTIAADYGITRSTTDGFMYIHFVANNNTVINITSSGYASLWEYDLTTNSSYESISIPMYPFNSIRLNIFNETSMSLITQNVTINSLSNLTTFTNITNTGTIIIDFLTPNEYELRFESVGFNPISKYITVLNDSTTNISIYMTENTTELQIVEILDLANQPVENAIVWLQKEMIGNPDQFITIQEARTNYEGRTTVWVERDLTVYYRFAVIYDGESRPIEPSGNLFTGKTYFIPDISETIQLIIDIENLPTDFISDRYAVSTNIYFGGVDNNTIFYEFLDGRNSISGATLIIKGKYLGNHSLDYEIISEQSASGSSGIINYTFIPINNTIYQIKAYITYNSGEELVWEGIKRFTIDVIVEKNTGLLYAVFLLIVVALVTVKYGPLVSGSITFGSLFIFNKFGLTDIPTTIITSIIALIIIVFGKTREK